MNAHSSASQSLLVLLLCAMGSSPALAQETSSEDVSPPEASPAASPAEPPETPETYPEEVSVSPDDGQEPFAQHDETQSAPEGIELFRQAQVRYDQGRYQEAVGLLLQLLELDPSAPDIYYNIALAYEHLTDFDQALYYLNMYREFDIGDEERERVERMMVRIRGAQEHAPPVPEPETHTRVVVQRFGRADAPFWAMVASTVLFAGAAAVTGGLALDWNRAAGEFVLGPDGDQDEHKYWVDTANTLALVTDVLIGVASAAAITALLLYVLRTHDEVEELTTESDGTNAGSDSARGDDGDSARGDDGDSDERQSLRRRRTERRRRLVPSVQVGVGAVIMGWNL